MLVLVTYTSVDDSNNEYKESVVAVVLRHVINHNSNDTCPQYVMKNQ